MLMPPQVIAVISKTENILQKDVICYKLLIIDFCIPDFNK